MPGIILFEKLKSLKVRKLYWR